MSDAESPPRNRSDTRTRIMDAAEDLVQRFGANATSYADVSEIVGIRKASIHHHFASKDDLLEAILERYAQRVFAAVDEVLAADEDAPTKLRRVFELDEGILRADQSCLYGMLGAELVSLQSRCVKQIRDFYAQAEKRFVKLLEQGIEEGTFHFQGDTKALANLIFCWVQGALVVGRARGGPRLFRSMAEQFFVLLGVQT